MVRFAQKQIERYAENPNQCPFCGFENIEAGPLEADGRTAWSNVICHDCGAEWQDVYRLVGVELPGASELHLFPGIQLPE